MNQSIIVVLSGQGAVVGWGRLGVRVMLGGVGGHGGWVVLGSWWLGVRVMLGFRVVGWCWGSCWLGGVGGHGAVGRWVV